MISIFVAPRFRTFSGEARTAQFNSFLEHWTISAAFILVVVVYLRQRPASYH